MKTSISIYALLVGINEYSDPRHRLEGCVRDVHRIKEYLETHFNDEEFTFRPKVLTDQEATRDNIIDGFGHFQEAKDGDICFFHYSGHGSRCPAPEAFWHVAPDHKHETIVCYDSRTDGGRDLLDKELSYLIWRATKGKEVHFMAIMDCCHSGTATRTTYSRPRQVQDWKEALKPEEYLGFEHYKKSGTSAYSPPRGRHVLLAAARANETAKEVYAGGEPCGIFTYCLLEALKGTQNQITYSELVNRVNFRVRNKVSDQSPQLEAIEPNDKERFFLTGVPASEGPSYLVAYDKGKKSWVLNAGTLHGIIPGDEASRTVVKLQSSGEEVAIREVQSHFSTLEGMQGKPEEQSFKARIQQMASPAVSVAFAPGNDPEGEQYLRDILARKPGTFFRIANRPEEANYLIHAKFGHFFLSKLDEDIPEAISGSHPLNKIRAVFKKIKGYSEASAMEFLSGLERASRWARLLELSNPATTIRDDEIEVQLFRTLDQGNYEDNVGKEKADWTNPGPFKYQKDGAQWCLPALQLKVKNTSRRTLWLSLSYFSGDFSISNNLMDKQELAPGEEAWALDIHDGIPYRTIPIQMDDAFNQWGITGIDEYIKLFICTEEFSTDGLNQKGLELDEPIRHFRTAGRISSVSRPDWATKEIKIHIHRPLEAKTVKAI